MEENRLVAIELRLDQIELWQLQYDIEHDRISHDDALRKMGCDPEEVRRTLIADALLPSDFYREILGQQADEFLGKQATIHARIMQVYPGAVANYTPSKTGSELIEDLAVRPNDEGEPWCPACESAALVQRVGDRFMCYGCGHYTYTPVEERHKEDDDDPR